MKKYREIIFTVICLFISAFLYGCRPNEDQVEKMMLDTMRKRYGVEFEMRFSKPSRNVRNGIWVGDVLTDELEGGTSVLVSFDPREKKSYNKIRDNYFITKYCLDVTNDFKNHFDLSGETFVYTTWMLADYTFPFEKGMTYEQAMKQYAFDEEKLCVTVLCEIGVDEPEEILNTVIDAMEKTVHENIRVSIWLYSKSELENERFRVLYSYNQPQKRWDSLNRVGWLDKVDGNVQLTESERMELIKGISAIGNE